MVSTGWGGVMVKLNPDPNLIGQAAKHFDSQVQFQTHKFQSVPKYQSKSIKTLELQSHRYKIKPASSLSLRCFIITELLEWVYVKGVMVMLMDMSMDMLMVILMVMLMVMLVVMMQVWDIFFGPLPLVATNFISPMVVKTI